MNALTDNLPSSVIIDNTVYEINTNFRDCLKIILAFENSELTQIEKQIIMLNILYKKIPKNIEKACELAIKFLNLGKEGLENRAEGIGRLYSFEKDSAYIFSAIQQTYGIDLERIEYLHWWKFIYLFFDLNGDCFFNKIVYLRRQKKLGKLTKEELSQYNNLRDIIDLPEEKSIEEQEEINKFFKFLKIEDA